jgi:hypothetical protein
VAQRNLAKTRQAAIEAARWSLDLQLRYRPPTEIDIARLDLWAAQLQSAAADEELDTAAETAGKLRDALAGLGPKN